MTWALLIQAIIKFLGPVLQDWLRHLLERLEPKGFLSPDEAAISAVFADARAQVPWYGLGRRRVLRACERVCRRRAGELALAATGAAPGPQLTWGEMAEIEG